MKFLTLQSSDAGTISLKTGESGTQSGALVKVQAGASSEATGGSVTVSSGVSFLGSTPSINSGSIEISVAK